MIEISHYKNIYQSQDGEVITLQEFLDKVKYQFWKNISDQIAAVEDYKERNQLKQRILPYVTISGKFGHRVKTDMIKHSGFICIDFDQLKDVNHTFQLLKSDPYTYAVFRSVSGRGLAVVVKIEGRRHLDAYLGLETYYANKYQEITDRSCKDTTRPRFVSCDPELFQNENSERFTAYLPKEEKRKNLPNIVTGKNDIDFILQQIKDSGLDLTAGIYFRYRDIGFALAHEFNESGREYFHFIASYNSKYNQEHCDKQYNNCLNAKSEGITIATLLYYAKQAGLSIMSPETKEIVSIAKMGRNAGRSLTESVEFLATIHNMAGPAVEEVVKKVYSQDKISAESQLSTIEALEIFIRDNYSIKRNEITRFIQNEGVDIDQVLMNSIYFRARKEIDDKIRFEEIERLIYSDHTPNFNPLKEYFQNAPEDERTLQEIITNGYIKQLADCIETDTGGPSYKYHVITKWLVGVVGSVYGKHSVLTLVFTGVMGNGKTEFFRRLLPAHLKPYYAESKLEAGKDDELLMTQKLIIMDDEFGGKNKTESKRFKELTSKEYFTLREPYGRKNITIARLCALAGTSNEDMVLSDPTGNRRVIPLRVISIDHDKYNAIDKDKVIQEAHRLFQLGYSQYLSKEDVISLNEQTSQFEQIRAEQELINIYIRKPGLSNNPFEDVKFMTATSLAAYLGQLVKKDIYPNKLGLEMKAAGFERKRKLINYKQNWGYDVVLVDLKDLYKETDNEEVKPFDFE